MTRSSKEGIDMRKIHAITPEHTAVRVALWRALHVHVDPKPHILMDEIGLKLVDEENWRSRQDMDPGFSKGMRASIVGLARFRGRSARATGMEAKTTY